MTPNVFVRVHYYPKGNPKRGFYSSAGTNDDYLGYVDRGVRDGSPSDYMDYAGDHDKSSGVFGKDGLLTPNEKSEMRKELKETDSVVWDLLISFEKNYGLKKMKSYRDALLLINEELPRFLKENGIQEDNVVWFAGLHENTDNRHIHISFFEKKPLRIVSNLKGRKFHNGPISMLTTANLKVRIEQRMDGRSYDLKSYRHELMDQAKGFIGDIDEQALYMSGLREKLDELYATMPKGGYGYMSREMDPVRPLINEITSYMLSKDNATCDGYFAIMNKLHKHDEETKEICLRDKTDPKRFLVEDTFRDDVYRRCGNLIINYVKEARLQECGLRGSYDPERKERWDEKKRRSFLFGRAVHLDAAVDRERNDVYLDFERRLAKAEHDRLVEEGVIEAE
jgi:hypothetical protein